MPSLPVSLTRAPLQYLLIIVLGAMVLLPGMATLPLLDRDEPRFAQATAEMAQRDDWVIPYFNGEYRFDKPVLTYWLMRAGYHLFGKNELGARFHSLFSAVLTALVLCWAGRRWFSPATGLAAGIGFLTCFQVILNGRSCVADMPMVLAVAVSEVLLLDLLRAQTPRHAGMRQLVLYISLGLGFLAKGPIAILVPVLSVLLFRYAFWRKPLPWANLRLSLGIPLTLLILAAWGVPALIRTNGQFWQVGIGEHVVRRGLTVFNGRLYFPAFYLVTAILSLFPWIAFAGRGWTVVREKRSMENAFLLSWLVSPYIIFSFYKTQLPHYVLPGFGAFFLILAQTLDASREKSGWQQWWYRGVVGLYGILIAVLLAFLWGVPFAAPYAGLRLCLWGVVGLLLALVSMAILFYREKIVWLPLAVVLLGISVTVLGTGMRRLSPAVQLLPIFSGMPKTAEYMGYRFMEGSLVFYSGGKWRNTADVERVQDFMTKPGARMVVALARERRLDRYLGWQWKKWQGRAAEMKTDEYADQLESLNISGYHSTTIEGVDMGNSTWVELRVFYKG